MKKSLLALAVLGAFASAASAQSSVTLSGMLDAGLTRIGTSTGYDWSMGGAGSAFNNFTLSGREDLGGGNYAFFTMNHRFRIQNGTINSADYGTGTNLAATANTSSPTFYRNIFVGLGGNFGDVRLGRILFPLQEVNGGFDPWYGGYTVASTHTGGIAATQRANNAIYYRSPSMAGLQLHAAIAAGQGQLQGETVGNGDLGGYKAPSPQNPGGFGDRPQGFALSYTAGPLRLAVAYDRNYANQKTSGFYAGYNFGVANVMMQYEDGDSLSKTSTVEKMKAFSLSANIPFGESVVGKVGYARFNSDLALNDAKKFGLGLEYKFSKRTLVYTDYGKFSGDRVTSAVEKARYDIGLRHSF